jgi:transcriptional regulator with XRE-family HTH domain
MTPQWGWHNDQEGTEDMPLGPRIREARKEAGWSQAELAEKVSTDPGRISRYESGRITPSADALVRLAEALNISIDYLLIDGVPRRPLHTPEHALGDQFARVGELDDDDIASLLHMLDALVAKKRLKTIAGDLA